MADLRKRYVDSLSSGNLGSNKQVSSMISNYDNYTPVIMKAVVVSNATVLKEGTIKVVLNHPKISPPEYDSGRATDLYNFHKNINQLKRDRSFSGATKTKNKVNFSNTVVDCYIGTPYSGSYQNSGTFICPPVNSRGLVLRIYKEYFWICGYFSPSIKKTKLLNEDGGIEPESAFLPFPSNMIEIGGKDFEATDNGMVKNSFDEIDKSGKEANKSTIISNGMIINPKTRKVDEDSVNTWVTRIPLTMGKDNYFKDGAFNEKNAELLKKQFNSILYPSHYIEEISNERFFIHKGSAWKSNSFPNENIEEKFYSDFIIGNLWKLDKYPNFSNSKINTESKYGVGFSVTDKENGARAIEYTTENIKETNLFNKTNEKKIDIKIDNSSETSINISLTNNQNKNINIIIDLNNLDVKCDLKDSLNNSSSFEMKNNEIDLQVKTLGTLTTTATIKDTVKIEDSYGGTFETTSAGLVGVSNNVSSLNSEVTKLWTALTTLTTQLQTFTVKPGSPPTPLTVANLAAQAADLATSLGTDLTNQGINSALVNLFLKS